MLLEQYLALELNNYKYVVIRCGAEYYAGPVLVAEIGCPGQLT